MITDKKLLLIVTARLINARTSMGLTQMELAKKLGKRQSSIVAYESGKHMFRIDTLLMLAHALDVTIDYFFEGVEDNEDTLAEYYGLDK